MIKELLQNDIPSGIYHLSDDESLFINEVAKDISLSLGLKPKLWAIPSNLIRTIANLGDKIKLPLNTERLHKLIENYIVSNQKIKSALAKELPVAAREGLKKTINSFQ